MVRMSHRLRIEHGTRLTDEFTSRISLIDKPNGAVEDDKGQVTSSSQLDNRFILLTKTKREDALIIDHSAHPVTPFHCCSSKDHAFNL